ncbi:MAG TPA: PEP-CTERM sorting domain-containing protein [Tepidisphaeraceae bacterium]|jgi:hypothetical protein
MHEKWLSFAAAFGCLAALSATTRGQVYDSGGFDNVLRFSPTLVNSSEPSVLGNLRGQDAAVKPWLYSGPNTTTVTTGAAQVITAAQGPVFSGTQAVRVNRFTGDNFWAPDLTTTVGTGTVKINWAMDVLPTNNANTFGPFFGIDAYGTGTSGFGRLGGVGVDASTGEFIYIDSGGFEVVNFNPVTQLGQQIGVGYHQYELDLSFASHTFSASVDAVSTVSGIPFATPGATQFLDGDIATLREAAGTLGLDGGTAYFDNYAVTPEPTTALGLFSAFALLLHRRRLVA